MVTQLRAENEKLSGEVKRASEVNSDMKAVIGKLEAAATRDVSQKTFFSASLTHRQDGKTAGLPTPARIVSLV